MNRTRIARLSLYAAAVLFLLGVAIYAVDGVRVRLFGIVFSARHAERPIVLAAVLVVISLFANREVLAGTLRHAGTRTRSLVAAYVDAVSRPAWAVAWCLAAGMLVYAITLGSRAASGADSSGYVSQAALWTDGELTTTEPLASAVPWPDAVATFAPLGYRPAPSGPKIVPTYPAGLPLLMALFRSAGGPCAVYLVVPLCGAALVLIAYAIGLQLGTPLSALAGMVLTVTSPTTLFMVLSPMSDVPVTAFWLASLLLAIRSGAQSPIASGIMAGTAILIRPNLAPLAIVPLALLAIGAAPAGRRAVLRAIILCGIPIAVGAGIVAMLNTQLYGGPFRSGYGASGRAASLYAIDNIAPNVKLYGTWLFESQGVLIAVSLVAVVVQLFWRTSLVRRLLAVFVVAVTFSYLPYTVFEVWWYLRFLLPALPLVYFFGADLVTSFSARAGRTAQVLMVTAFVAAASVHGIAFGFERDMYGAAEGEQRYVEVARFIKEQLPRQAVIIAMQHGGSVRYYSGNVTIRYDLLTAARLDQAVHVLRGLGYGPYLVLEDWEEPRFRDRFKDQETINTLDSRLFASLDSNTGIRIYDLSNQPPPPTPHHIRHVPRTECPGRFND